ncbi:MAG: protein kinase [Gemmatimonadaceae bacterium]
MSLRDQLQQTLGAAYRLERELGGGGMSRVFVAEETSLGRKVVVKVLPPEIAAGVNADRFKREIQVAARLQHPHIVPVLSAGEMEGVPYYTMPFVEGESVRARLARSGALSITEIIGILRDVAKALAYAHERGIVHRDIKPDNVLLSGGSATVTDFGIAKAIAASRTDGGDGKPETLTSIGSSIGTPAYMAPEQAAADPATNHRADLYAFGCMAYELLAGRPPFIEKTPQKLLAAQMSDTPEPIASLRLDTPDAMADLVMRCLAKDADARPQSAHDLVQVLDNVTSGGGHSAMPTILLGGQGMIRKALLAYAAAFVFVAVLAKAAIVAIGLPDWVYPGALVVMALGLPVILFTAYVHHTTRRLVTQTPTYTPGGTPSANHGTMATLAVRASPHVSWRRTWLGGVFAVGAFVALIGAYMVLRALGVGPFASLLAAGTLQKNEKLLVADFTSTGDTSIAPVATDAFRTALGQSRSVRIVQPNEVRDVLRRMQKPPNTAVDFAVAREVATREGAKAVVLGNIIALGGNYAISVRLVSPQNGDELGTFRETADGDKALLPAIDKLAKDMRAKIGESLRQVQSTPRLERVTTPSLEALKKYVQGSRIMSEGGEFAKGAALLEEAIALDTAFAMAYRRLAAEYANQQRNDRSMELLQKAYDHRDRLSDAERYVVLGSYWNRGPRQDLAKSTAAYETLLELQPDFNTALNNVAINYRWQRNWAKAEEYLKRSIAIEGAPAVSYNQLIWVLLHQGKRDEAWRLLARYDSVYPASRQRQGRYFELYYNERRFDSAAAAAAMLFRSNDPGARAFGASQLGLVARMRGRLRESARWDAEARQVNLQRGVREASVLAAINGAAVAVQRLGDSTGAVARLDGALRETQIEQLPEVVRPYAELAETYARAGRPDRARELLAAFERARGQVVRYQDDRDRARMAAAIALAEKRYDDAGRLFQAADQGDCVACALPGLAEAFDLAGKPDSALAVYERYFAVTEPFRWQVDQHFLAPSHRRAGELHEAQGNRQKAAEHYLAFIDLWKGADAELQPKVAEVRRRVARLGDVERR